MEAGYYGKGGIIRIRIGYLVLQADPDGRFPDLDNDQTLARRLSDDGLVEWREPEPQPEPEQPESE
jgi:hypothetical protein